MKIKRNELMFIIGITILSLRSLIEASSIMNIEDGISNVLLLSAYICFLINIVVNKVNLKEMRNI